MSKEHSYTTNIEWTGNKGSGTSTYLGYSRDHVLRVKDKPDLLCSSDTIFHGDKTRYNPEDFLVASLSTCHMLWYLHLCADAGIVVISYSDEAKGTLNLDPVRSRFTSVILHPVVTITDPSKKDLALSLHDDAHHKCFISNSCNFPITHRPQILVAGDSIPHH